LPEDIAAAVEAGGARLLTVHCRTREEGYRGVGDWKRLRRAVAAVSLPVCGNGGIGKHEDIERMIAETGCAYVMVGRAVLEDPWIFSGRHVSRAEAARFFTDYARLLRERHAAPSIKIAGRFKQLIRRWSAGGLFDDSREWWMRQRDAQPMLDRLEREFPRTDDRALLSSDSAASAMPS
jgi:tRNA-dihydrouridine synthase